MGETSTEGKDSAEVKGRTEEAKLQSTAQTAAKTEVSASTIGRMMGLATAIDLSLIEGKLDLLSTKVNNLTVRMEKVLTAMQSAPTGTDLERIDVQIGAVKLSIKELIANLDIKTTLGENNAGKKSTVIVEAETKGSGSATESKKEESKEKRSAQSESSN